MDRQWESGAAVSPPALTNASTGYATPGNPGVGTPATKPGAHMWHMVVEEILSVISAAAISFDKTVVTQLRDAIKAMVAPKVNSISLTGTQNDIAITMNWSRVAILYTNNGTLLTMTGFAVVGGNQDGDVIHVVPRGTGQVDLPNQNGGSVAADRLQNAVTSCVTSLAGNNTGAAAIYRYDGGSSYWRLVQHEQGAWIASSITTATPTGGGTISVTTINDSRYMIRGKTLHWVFSAAWTPTGTVTLVSWNLPIASASAAGGSNPGTPATLGTAAAAAQAQLASNGSTMSLGLYNTAGASVALGAGNNLFTGTFMAELT